MLGRQISDPEGVESGGTVDGMGLLPVTTQLQDEKVRRQMQGTIDRTEGIFSVLSGLSFEGYEIHMGRTTQTGGEQVFCCGGNDVYGTYIHGIFDKGETASALVKALAKNKGVDVKGGSCMENAVCTDYRTFKEQQYDKLADIMSAYLNMEEIYGMLREACL